jgi:acyl-CoA thioester hydrolase
VIENHCNFFAPLAFPQTIDAGIRVSKIGKSSVRYEVGLFAEGENLCAALAHFIHVYVNAHDRRPVKSLPPDLQIVLEKLR